MEGVERETPSFSFDSHSTPSTLDIAIGDWVTQGVPLFEKMMGEFQDLRQMLLLPQMSSLVDLLLLRIQDSNSSPLLVVVLYSQSLVEIIDSFLDILDLV